MKDYQINYATNTVKVSGKFAEKAQNRKNEEHETMEWLRKEFKVVYTTRTRSKTANHNKGLTYANMEKYIGIFDNRDELLENFRKAKEASCVQKNKFQYVKNWFVTQFPDYEKIPQFSLVSNVIPVDIELMKKIEEDLKKAKEESKSA